MKRSLLYLLLAVVVAGWLGTLIARDPGYVLVSYDGATLQTGLWVMLGLLTAVIVAGYYLLKAVKLLMGTSGYFRNWRSERARLRSVDLTSRGLTLLQTGDFERAEKFLIGGANNSNKPAANYIYAARAADAQGKAEARDKYLREAREADAGAADAIAMAGAEMAAARGEWRTVLQHLDDLPGKERTLLLRSKALLGLNDWQGLAAIMPQLGKAIRDEEELFALQKKIAIERLSAGTTADDALSVIYRKLPDAVRRDVEVIKVYCENLDNESEVESVVRGALRKDWQPELLSIYGKATQETVGKRIKTAEGWLKRHADEAALHLCLGELYETDGDKEKAKVAYQKSIDLGDLPAASAHLGRLLAFDGDYRRSNEHLAHALRNR